MNSGIIPFQNSSLPWLQTVGSGQLTDHRVPVTAWACRHRLQKPSRGKAQAHKKHFWDSFFISMRGCCPAWRGLLSVPQSGPTLCDPMDCSMPGFPIFHYLPECAQTHIHWVGDTIQPSHPPLPPSPPAFYLSQNQGLFPWICSLHQVAQVLKLQFQHQFFPSNEYSGLISFSIDRFDLHTVQGTLKSLLLHHSSKVSILQRSAFFMVRLSLPYMTTGKTIALTMEGTGWWYNIHPTDQGVRYGNFVEKQTATHSSILA